MLAVTRWRGMMLGLAGAGALAAALVLASGKDARAPTRAEPATRETAAPATREPAAPATREPAAAPRAAVIADEAPAIDDILRAQADPAAVANDVLVAGLASADAVVVAESANGLVARGALDAVPALVELDVLARPWAAPSIIHAMGRLAAIAEDEDRGAVVDRLLALMAAEKQRGAQESQGNLLQIYEALGDTGDARAIAPLERELIDASVATAPKVIVVQALVALGARQSRATLEQLRDQLAATATGTDFEALVRRDLLAAIRDALVQLS